MCESPRVDVAHCSIPLRLRARRRPHAAPHRRPILRLSRIFRQSETTPDPDGVPLVRVLLWGLFAVVLVVGLVLYFKYERVVMPLLS